MPQLSKQMACEVVIASHSVEVWAFLVSFDALSLDAQFFALCQDARFGVLQGFC